MGDIWTKLDDRNSLVSKGTQYRNMQTWQRKCALCGTEFIAHTPGNAPADKPPTVTTCEEHRGAPNGISYGWLAWDGKGVVPGPRMKVGATVQSAEPAGTEELKGLRETLEAWGVVWKSCYPLLTHYGLAGIDTFAKAVHKLAAENNARLVEIQVLKAKLAPYELQSTMEAVKNKMPWE